MPRKKTLATFYDDYNYAQPGSSISDDPIPGQDTEYPFWQWLWYWMSGERSADIQADNQDWLNDQEAQRQLELQQEAAMVMPSAQMEGLRNVGFSGAAAAQAIAGGSGVAAPSFSSGGSASAPAGNPLNGILDLIPAFLQQKLVNAQAQNLGVDTEVKQKRYGLDKAMTEAQVAEIKDRIRNNAFYRDLSSRQQDVAEMIADVQVGKTKVEVDKLYNDIEKIQSEILRNLAETELVSKQAIHELIKISATRQGIAESKSRETLNYANTSVAGTQAQLNTQLTYESEARTDKTQAETQGQYLTNDEQRMSNYIKEKRIEVSQMLGFEVDAPQVTQVLEAMVDGDLSACIQALEYTDSSVYGAAYRWSGNVIRRDRSGRNAKRHGDYQHNTFSNPSHKSDHHVFWYPGYRD